jgi:hypothetical protein
MKIEIKSIEAEILNAATMTSSSFIIKHWVIQYEVTIGRADSFCGKICYKDDINAMDPEKIIEYIESLYKGTEEIILKEK